MVRLQRGFKRLHDIVQANIPRNCVKRVFSNTRHVRKPDAARKKPVKRDLFRGVENNKLQRADV